jgi:REP element-mobilizing transposase RayT
MEYKARKSTRLETFDYNSVGAYFITICTQNKEHLLSQIILKDSFVGTGVPDGPQTSKEIFVELTEYGKIADKYINQLNDFYENISVDDYIIMPNHIHLLINIHDNGPSGTPVPTKLVCVENSIQNSIISQFISTFKRFSNKEYGKNIWQMRSFDHIIRDNKDYEFHIRYIRENPLKWYFNGENHDDITLYE